MSVPTVRAGLWALPGYGVLLGLTTVTHQPPVSDFDAYARYVSTDVFLISHLGASIFGVRRWPSSAWWPSPPTWSAAAPPGSPWSGSR